MFTHTSGTQQTLLIKTRYVSQRLILCITLLCSFMCSAPALSQTYTFTQSFAGPTYGVYHIDVMRAALRVTEDDYGAVTLERHPFPMPQGRQILTLLRGESDIMWSVTTDELEQQLLPVRFPLLQGLGGHRIFVINKNKQNAFGPGQTLDGIKLMTSVQGSDWPDTKILQYHGFTVASISWSDWYTTMYRSLEEGIIDYFPRNVVEVYRDLSYHNSDKLTIEQNHLIIYPGYEYFFVAPHAPELQQRLQDGLTRLLKSGELAKIFNRYPEHRKAWDMVKKGKRVVHLLESNVLSYSFENPDWIEAPYALLNEISALQAQPL